MSDISFETGEFEGGIDYVDANSGEIIENDDQKGDQKGDYEENKCAEQSVVLEEDNQEDKQEEFKTDKHSGNIEILEKNIFLNVEHINDSVINNEILAPIPRRPTQKVFNKPSPHIFLRKLNFFN